MHGHGREVTDMTHTDTILALTGIAASAERDIRELLAEVRAETGAEHARLRTFVPFQIARTREARCRLYACRRPTEAEINAMWRVAAE